MSDVKTKDELTHDATSRTLETAKGELHYHVAGEGPSLLLLHGSGPGVSAWANFGGNYPLFSKHFTTYALDFPGFGKSYSSDGNPMFAAPPAVLDFLDGLGLSSVAIIGNSMGGAIGSGFAAEHPDRVHRLVTIGGVGLALFNPSPPEGIKLLVQFCADPTRERLVTWMESMVSNTAMLTDEFVETRWQAAQAPGALDNIKQLFTYDTLKAMQSGAGRAGAATSVDRMTKIQAPTLVTWGRDDRVTPLDGCLTAMRLIPKCELHVFYDCGHWAMIERKDEWESTVLAFLMRDLERK
jgi:2-hydroxy-6-oxonona-2,4-dienedioate hydrolase